MKVKVGELKTHLSKYLRQMQESREAIEVCMREEPVAYLTPLSGGVPGADPSRAVLERRLAEVGLSLANGAGAVANPREFKPVPSPPGDGREGVDTVREMREAKDY
jgi:antitoxin (DNA-binding transcriptional repressor) of toxin-antitoxin stability system